MEKYKCIFCVSLYCVRMYQINTHLIGLNAGKVWNVLKENQSLTQHQILTLTGLNSDKFNQVIGWLSRENKVRKDGEFFSLSETNLTASIGANASLVVTVLEDLKESVEGLQQLTMIQPDEFQQAIGWLSREGHFQIESDQNTGMSLSGSWCDDEKIQHLHNEVEQLNDEVVSRNHIISELSRQLSATQTRFIQNLDVVEKLNMQLARTPHLNSTTDERLSESSQKIHHLENEISSLHTELNSRNHIIGELSRQLTSTQTTIITQADQIERLNVEMTKKQTIPSGSVSQSLKQRLRRITQLQKSLDTHHEPELMTETKFYDTHSPVLDISQSQHISDEELREALEELHQDIDGKIGQKKLQLHQDDSC
jgi:predicted RNase H-like nuclease (RuvC/YqgF family)